MVLKNLKISQEAHAKLLAKKAELQATSPTDISFSKLIMRLINDDAE